ncbi:MAG: tRNA lysidine(34) synthetase TilS, partial [Acidobacteriaceae bacterium]
MAEKTKVRVNKDAPETAASLPLDTTLFVAGDRVCVAVSGGVDSTALLRTLLARREELGIVLSVLHVEHGLRGQAAADDAAFVRALAEQCALPCEVVSVDTPQRMAEHKESVETAARALRYQAFRDVLAAGNADKVATAHTLDDQAETVLMKLLRGAWTEGLSGIHPELRMESATSGAGRNGHARRNLCVRPFLAVQRAQIEAHLQAIGQPWRRDETNDSLAHTRNRIRHELLPKLREFNPQIDSILAHMADNARAEEQHWQAELDRLLPLLLLPGKPTRGGGRSVSTSTGSTELAIEIARLHGLDPALLRRVLRAAAERVGATLDFDATERLLALVESDAPGSTKR